MPIKSPNERVYYYECSYGTYRLTVFIPPSELRQLVKENKIKKQAQEDFPDGVDLRVGETDYRDFKETYGYRPKTDPQTAEKIFYTYLSSTKNWKQFRGSGLIPAQEIDQKTPESGLLQTTVKTQPKIPTTKKVRGKKIPQTDRKDLERHRLARKKQTKKQNQTTSLLNKAKPKEIDPTKSLQMQQFQIRYTEGESIEKVFTRIQHKRRPKP